MQSKWLGRIGLTALVMGAVGSSGGMVGCAAEREPINRVQLNAIPKSFLVGEKFSDPSDDPEFYARSMVIDVPYGESGSDFLMFTNTINSMSKIKWQIEETKLVGRITFERITGTDGQGPPGTPVADRDPNAPLAQNNGLVVYEFAIEKQFDIRRAYNAQTGEESNVIEENENDRPWNDREYVRVDFSKNLVTTAYDFDTLSLLGVYNGITYSPLEFDIRNPNDENAPKFDLDKGYFDVTNKLFAEPKMLDLGGWVVPGCMLPNLIGGGTEPVGNCNPNELTLRHSFKRVVDTDYEPMDWDGHRFETYGAFTTVRNGYARDYGPVDSKWKRYISRYNIWERSHYYKEDAATMKGAVACQSDTECESIGAAAGMSHCDTANAKCTLPFRDRVAKPIVWHYADKSPPEYFDATREATEEWDTAMRGAVLAAKYAECKRYPTEGQNCGEVFSGNFAEEEDAMYLVKEVNACRRGEVGRADCDAFADEVGGARGYSSAVIALAKAKPMIMLCHSPVAEKDAPECGEKGTIARLGDLRFHLVTAVATPQTNSPWGIMSDSNDPTTGEHIASSINIWSHVNDLFSRGLVDTLRYIGGELKTEDITDGKYVDDWVQAARLASGAAPKLTGDEIDKRVAAAAGTTVAAMHAAQAASVSTKSAKGFRANPNNEGAKLRRELVQQLNRVRDTKAAFDAPSLNAPMYQARINLAKGSPLEAQVATPAMQQLAQSSFGQIALDNTTKVQATSLFQGLNPAMRRGFQQRRELALAARGACVMNYEATAPLGYTALGDILQAKFGKFNANDSPKDQNDRADRMKDYIRRRAQYAVIAHEMGHSIGLRHNFVSSSDSWNFRPQYWQLRTNDTKVSKTACEEDGTSDSAKCIGPRWVDQVTNNESKNMISMWTQSSTMEYPGEPSQDLLGLGTYDFGAARMFYGDVATVYNEDRFKSSEEAGTIALDHQNDFGGLLGFQYGELASYAQLDGTVKLISNCHDVSNVEQFRPANWNDEKDGAWSPLIDGHLVTNEQGKTTRCEQPKVDFVQWTALKDGTSSRGQDRTHAHDGTAATGRVRVPHSFASDEWADLGNVAVFRHDNGADLYETMHFWIAQQEMNHIFDNYRRGRRNFSIWGAFQRTLGRYHEKMRDAGKAIALYASLSRDTVAGYKYIGEDMNDPRAWVATVLRSNAAANTVASSIAFDHFAHVFSRPQPGEHGSLGDPDDTVMRSWDGTGLFGPGVQDLPAFSVPNGVTGGFGTISLGGRPVENALARNKGRDYDRDYTLNVGSYYEKAFTAMLFTESADNFISSSRDDFVDPRFRAVSLADVFPDGYRRWLANNLTGDDAIKGVHVRGASGQGPQPAELDPKGFALLGQTSWWPTAGIETCFPQGERITCRDPFATTAIAGAGAGPVVDPQIGWEQQKFAIIESLIYLPANQRTNWLDQIRIYELGVQSDPGFENRIEFHDPDGHVYIAQTFGTEVLYGKTVQRGVGARVLEYANELLRQAVVTAPITRGTVTIGYAPVLDAQGKVQYLGGAATCDNSRACLKLKNYVSIPKLVREGMQWLGWTPGAQELKGVY